MGHAGGAEDVGACCADGGVEEEVADLEVGISFEMCGSGKGKGPYGTKVVMGDVLCWERSGFGHIDSGVWFVNRGKLGLFHVKSAGGFKSSMVSMRRSNIALF